MSGTPLAIGGAALAVLAGCAGVNPRPAFEDVRSSVGDRDRARPEWSRTADEASAADHEFARLLAAPLTLESALS